MRRVLWIVGLVLLSSAALAETTLMQIDWQKLKAEGILQTGEIVSCGGVECLRITNSSGQEMKATLFSIENPKITSSDYAITGRVAYEGVEGKGYLEMLSYFPNAGPFFSRTLNEGPMAPMTGSSANRAFALPFFMQDSNPKPTKLMVNLVLPGKGTVYLSPMRLVQNWTGSRGLMVGSKWRSGGDLGRIGGSLGAMIGGLGGLVGLLGAIIGVLSGLGKGRQIVMWLFRVMISLGLAAVVASLVGLISRQWWVFYVPLLYVGLLTLVLALPLMKVAQKRFDELEFRRMSAQDV